MRKFLVLLAALLHGCSSFTLTSPTQESLAGRWNLTAVDGTPLPYAAPHIGSNKVEIVEDVLTITPPNTFTEATTVRTTENGQVTAATVTDSGTYEFTSYTMMFHFQGDGSIGAGTLTGTTMKIITSGISFTYEKEP